MASESRNAGIESIIIPRTRDLGDGFEVRRALPSAQRRTVGPFVFFDQMGPVVLRVGRGLDVRPHPHIGLATVTYLFDGEIRHRDHPVAAAGRVVVTEINRAAGADPIRIPHLE